MSSDRSATGIYASLRLSLVVSTKLDHQSWKWNQPLGQSVDLSPTRELLFWWTLHRDYFLKQVLGRFGSWGLWFGQHGYLTHRRRVFTQSQKVVGPMRLSNLHVLSVSLLSNYGFFLLLCKSQACEHCPLSLNFDHKHLRLNASVPHLSHQPLTTKQHQTSSPNQESVFNRQQAIEQRGKPRSFKFSNFRMIVLPTLPVLMFDYFC